MSREVLDFLQNMDTEKAENQLVLQCAPVITGMKISNLLIIQNHYLRQISKLLSRSKISYYVLYASKEKATALLYDRKKLEHYIAGEKVRLFFRKSGYEDFQLEAVFRRLRKRYEIYRQNDAVTERKRLFPHELGLLLGYPLEDVQGFIQNGGKNSLYTGYWKVYYNVPLKKALFLQYERARETLIELVSNGVGIAEILDVYDDI